MTIPINPGRLILATIFAPLIVSILTVAFFMALESGEAQIIHNIRLVALISGLVSALIGWPAMLIIGLPAHGILCAKNMRRWYYYAIAGALTGIVAMVVFSLIAEGRLNIPPLFLALASFGGAFAAVLFHFIRGPHLALTRAPNPAISTP